MSSGAGRSSPHSQGSAPPTQSDTPRRQASYPPTASPGSRTGPPTQQQHPSMIPALQNPSVKFVYGEVVTLLQKVGQVDRSFQEKEKECDERVRQFEIFCETEKVRIESEYAKAEVMMNNHRQRMQWEKDQLLKEKKEFDEYMDRATARMSCSEEETGLVTLSVGGDTFTTEIATLRQKPRSIFPGRLSKVLQEHHDRNKVMKIFIDRDSRHFRLILNYLRMGEEALYGTALKNADQSLLHEVLCEARFYHLQELEQLIEWRMVYLKPNVDFTKLSVFVKGSKGIKYATKPTQDHPIALEECNLSGVVFDSVYFSCPMSFRGSVLDGAVFAKCVFEAVVNFTNASLRGVRFEQCAGVEPDNGFLAHEDMKGVHFNPPLD